jgi:hypothetical protein
MNINEIALKSDEELVAFLKENGMEQSADTSRDELEKSVMSVIEAKDGPQANEGEGEEPQKKDKSDKQQHAAGKASAAKRKQAAGVRAIVKAEEEGDSTPQYAEMDIPDLLDELHMKGFRTKEELTAYLEALNREKKTISHLHEELNKREEGITQGEIKLQQRIIAAEKEMEKLQTQKREIRIMLERYQALKREHDAVNQANAA